MNQKAERSENLAEDAETRRFRRPTGLTGKVAGILAAILPLYLISYILNVLRPFGLWIDRQSFVSSFLGMMLGLTFIFVPATKGAKKDRVPVYDIVLALLGVAGGLYATFCYGEMRWREGSPTASDLIFGFITVILLLEATRRLVGWPFLSVALAFLLYARFTYIFPGLLHGRGYSVGRLISSLYIGNQGIFGTPTDMAAGVIFSFVLFGQLLSLSGSGDWIMRLAYSIAGPYRGGPAKIAVVASALFGTISGSPVANVLTTGVFTIPMMKNIGYRPHFAGAVEAVASTGGMIMPPVMGAVAFLMAQFLQISYATIAIAAFLPACLYYFSVFMQVHLEAVKTGMVGIPRSELTPPRKILPQGWHFIIPIGVLVYFLIIRAYPPDVSGLYASLAVLLVSLARKGGGLGFKRVIKILEGTSLNLLLIAATCAASGIIIASVSTTGLGVRLSQLLVDVSGGNLFILLLLTAITSGILGMGLPVIPAYIVLVILVAPALVTMGIAPLQGHLFIMYFAVLSFITPPVAIAVYAACGLAGSDLWKTGLQAVRLGIVAYIVPFMFIYSPALLLSGTVTDVSFAVATAIVGVIGLSFGVEGYALKRTTWPERILLTASGVLLIMPGWKTDIAGLGILAAVLLWQYVTNRRARIAGAGSD